MVNQDKQRVNITLSPRALAAIEVIASANSLTWGAGWNTSATIEKALVEYAIIISNPKRQEAQDVPNS